MRVEGDLHLGDKHVGHTASPDCWCEPSSIFLFVIGGLPGVTRVIEHNDETNDHHLVILNRRERDRALVNQLDNPDAAWITRALDVETPPKLLPPHDPNQRSL